MTNRYLAILNELKSRTIDDSNKNSRVLVIDGLNTFIRCYAASPVLNDDGEHVGGISGFLLSIGHAIKAINPTRVIIVFDGKNGSARRKEIYPEYKAHRNFKVRLNRAETVDKQDNQLHQLIRLTEYLSALPITIIVQDNTEADDVIAYIVNDHFADSHCFIMSSDKDFLQLITERVHVWSPTKKKLYYVEDVFEEFGVYPHNFALFKAIIGDASDNIPGVDGVGAKTLLKRFDIIAQQELLSLDNFLQYVEGLSDKTKTLQTMKDSKEILERNLRLVQLSDSNMSVTNKLKTQHLLEQPIPRFAKPVFHKMLIEDKMTTAIKNVDFWLREVVQKLDMYALKD
jgi:DNA polymerase-1